jgi:hypothetical protein
MKSRVTLSVVTGGILIAVGLITYFVLAPRSTGEDRVDLPAVWTATVPSDGELWENAEINLNEGGTASLSAVPAGEIMVRDGRTCLKQSGELYSGEAEWAMGDAPSVILVKYPEGGFPLVADGGKFGSYDWLDASTPFCDGGATATYGRR